MSPSAPLLAFLLAAAPARAGVGRAVEISLPGESVHTPAGAPAITLQLNPANLAPSLSPAALTPALAAPSNLVPSALPVVPLKPVAQPVALTPDKGAPVKAIDSLKVTGTALGAAKPESNGQTNALDALFTGGTARDGAPSVEIGDPGSSPPSALKPSTPSKSRKMPAGVAKAFGNSAVLGGGMAALSVGMWAMTGKPALAAFALAGFPLVLIPFHFALVSAFWALRYYGYPRMSDSGKTAFRAAFTALSLAYPAVSVAALTAWLIAMAAASPAILALFGLPFLVALGEVTHHFIYRGPAERAQDKGKSILDWRSRLGGNIGQQLHRMRAKKS